MLTTLKNRKKLKKILAIDPGPMQTAYVIFDGTAPKIYDRGHLPNHEFRRLFIDYPKSDVHVACEMIASYGMPVGHDIFETCVMIGRIEEIALQQKVSFTRILRKDVKVHICGSVRAKDGNIRQALIDKLGAPGTKKQPGTTYGVSGDVWAALAVAVYSFEHDKTLL